MLTEHGQDPFHKLNSLYKVKVSYSLEDETNFENENDNSETSSNLDEKIDENSDEILSNFDQTLMENICKGKNYINMINLFNFINLLYKLIVFKLQSSANEENNWNVNLKDMLIGLMEELNQSDANKLNEEAVDLEEFNITEFKLKNVYHLWQLIVNIYLSKK